MYLALERYSRPASLEECLALLSGPGERAALLAGGTELNVRGHDELTHVIDVQALPLRGVAERDGALHVGALTTLSELRRAPAFAGALLTALREAAAGYAVIGLQNRSTLGGRVGIDRGDQDLPAALLALGARVRLVRRAPGGGVEERWIDYPAGEQGRAELAGAVIAEVALPLGDGVSAHRRFGRTAVDTPLANASCALRRDASGSSGIRVAVNVQAAGAAGLRRLIGVEELVGSWNGERPSDWREQLREQARAEAAPYADAWVSADYRRNLCATLVVRAVAATLGEEEVV